MIVTKDEINRVIGFNLSKSTYLKAVAWYILIVGIVCIVSHFGLWQKYYQLAIQKGSVLSVAVFSAAIYLLMSVMQFLLVKLLPIHNSDEFDERFRDKIAIVIPCHNSSSVIAQTLDRALLHFDGNSIYVADNNRHERPQDSTPVIALEKGVNYIYYPKSGKTNALYETGKTIQANYDYFLLIDDDTLLPRNFCPSEKFFEDEKVSTVGFGIKIKELDAVSENLVDWEYKMLSWRGAARKYWSLKLAFGIAHMWRTEAFLEVYEINPCRTRLPFGEDGWAGLITRMKGNRIKQDTRNFVESYAPKQMFYSLQDLDVTKGKSAISGYDSQNIWKQRVMRWYRNYIIRVPYELSLALYYDAGGVMANIMYRLDLLYCILLAYWSITIPAFLFYVIDTGDWRIWLLVHASAYLFGMTTVLFNNYVTFRRRKDLQIQKKYVILLYPAFTMYVAVMRLFGCLGAILYYIPFCIIKGELEVSGTKGKGELKVSGTKGKGELEVSGMKGKGELKVSDTKGTDITSTSYQSIH